MTNHINSNDLGLLQQDLENLLCILHSKYSTQKRLSVSTSTTEGKNENLPVFKTEKIMPSPAPVERKLSTSDEKPLKKIKISYEKPNKPSPNARAKNKRSANAKMDFDIFDKSSEVSKAQKNDNRFWLSMEPYCADISMDDIKMLEKWIESHENDAEYKIVPPLGTHYSLKWMEDDILEEMKEGSKAVENPKGLNCESMGDQALKDLLQKVQDEYVCDNSEPSPLLQNLITSLVRENFITCPNKVMTECMPEEDDLFEKSETESKTTSQVFEESLEKRLLLELTQLGVLESVNIEEEDELLLELKKLQTLLVPVSKINLLKKENLLMRAKAEMAKQESQKRMQEVDAKVMESYRTMLAARKREGKKLSKKELFQIRTVLEEREKLLNSSNVVNNFEMCSEN